MRDRRPIKEVPSIAGAVAEIFEDIYVVLVGAAPADHHHLAAHGHSIGGVICAGQYFVFLNAIHPQRRSGKRSGAPIRLICDLSPVQ